MSEESAAPVSSSETPRLSDSEPALAKLFAISGTLTRPRSTTVKNFAATFSASEASRPNVLIADESKFTESVAVALVVRPNSIAVRRVVTVSAPRVI